MVVEAVDPEGIADLAAQIEATAALSHVDGVSDSARARELYKYYQPTAPINADTCFPPPQVADDAHTNPEVDVRSEITSTKISSPDTALTAFCQLVTWRTGAQRAMISLIDDATQYFIAESTKTVDLIDNTKHAPGDAIWMGCSSVSKAGRLCERTIKVAPKKVGGTYPSFVVDDLSTDEQFNELPFVTGPPLLRFYAGVPLITRRGIPIGSLFIVDDRVRPPLSKDYIDFMGTMAGTIMKHISMVAQVEEHRRGMKMNRGLASLIEGRGKLVVDEASDVEDTDSTELEAKSKASTSVGRTSPKVCKQVPVGSVTELVQSSGCERKEKSLATVQNDAEILAPHVEVTAQLMDPVIATLSQSPSSYGTTVAVSSPQDSLNEVKGSFGDTKSEITSRSILFSRAANLIREAFEVDGGAVFYDARKGFGSDMHRKRSGHRDRSHADSYTSSDGLQSARESFHAQGDAYRVDLDSTLPPPTTQPELPKSTFPPTFTESKAANVLGFSTATASSIQGDRLPGPATFSPLNEKSLYTLLRRYPRGKIWSFDSDGAMSSSSEEDSVGLDLTNPTQLRKDIQNRQSKSARNKSDATFLSRHFPGVRQLLFVPLWDAGLSRGSSVCFAWSTDPTRILSKQSELAFLSAFGNSVMAECSRIDTEIADQKKGDFIGSISHELRSPLHGILASAEFLRDEVTTGFEKGLVETIDSCGRTLLDTINHVLDFSKINHFEKTWRKKKRGRNRSVPRTSRGALDLQRTSLPVINLLADVDISVLCEEVVEGVFAGHAFQNVAAQGFDTTPHTRGERLSPRKGSSPILDSGQLQNSEVAVILDVDFQNYQFTTQPGAFRRVIMNLLGNALKYTSRGYVRIKLEATDIEEPPTPGGSETSSKAMVVLTITDTGKGISSEFLRSKVFTPFAQENSLSSGTGLGLSIVRSIVSVLEGDITIDSEQERGTQVTVTLPLTREMPSPPPLSTSTNPGLAVLHEDDCVISELRAYLVGQKASLHGFESDSTDPITNKSDQLLKTSITNFLANWYGLEVVAEHEKANIIIANEADTVTVSELIHQSGNKRNPPLILVLCHHPSRFNRSLSDTDGKYNIGFVAKPVGPSKLAKALINNLQGAPSTIAIPARESTLQEESKTLNNGFKELSLSPHGGEIWDNSRMATNTENARKAMRTSTPKATVEKQTEFPFPARFDEEDLLLKAHNPPAGKLSLKPLSPEPVARNIPTSSLAKSINNSTTGLADNDTIKKSHSARLLLVDDNRINLTLLRTYLRKRKYDVVDEAENGLEAVQKFQERKNGYDIIFMDISMPVMNGFEATRQIRAIEGLQHKKDNITKLNTKSHRHGDGLQDKDLEESRTPSLVIALTGLASSRDQSEAFASGIDLFLTKPVAFKEVGKLLDNWELNRGGNRDSSVVS